MSIQNVILPEDTFGLGASGEEVGDETTDTSTKEGSALTDTMDEYHANKPSAQSLDEALNGPDSSPVPQGVSEENKVVEQTINESVNKQMESNPNNNQQPVSNVENNVEKETVGDVSDDAGTIKPKFTDPDMFNIMDFSDNDSSIEVL